MVSLVSTVTVDLGASALLHCCTDANPAPAFTWTRGLASLPSGAQYQTTQNVNDGTVAAGGCRYQSTLSVAVVGATDVGSTFVCLANNQIGSATSSFIIALRSE